MAGNKDEKNNGTCSLSFVVSSILSSYKLVVVPGICRTGADHSFGPADQVVAVPRKQTRRLDTVHHTHRSNAVYGVVITYMQQEYGSSG